MDWFVQVFSSPVVTIALYACWYIIGRKQGRAASDREWLKAHGSTAQLGVCVGAYLAHKDVSAVTVMRGDEAGSLIIYPERLPS